MSKIYIPAVSADQWAQFLADPVKHWRKGYSARTLAYSWQEANGFPIEVQRFLATQFPDIELLLAFPEHQVPLLGGSRPSQNDIWVLARSAGNLISIAVEGKVSETFGPTVQEWRAEASSGKSERLNFLCGQLGIQSDVPDTLRYQLLHRTVSALIEATRFGAAHAVMLQQPAMALCLRPVEGIPGEGARVHEQGKRVDLQGLGHHRRLREKGERLPYQGTGILSL